MLKKIDKLVLSGFYGPYILSFFIAEFVLVMQFLWKYIDDILGKGFSSLQILELIFYYGLSIVPMSLPISILLSSVMVFGDMAEKHEIPTMKSAGISLIRIMKAGIIVAIFTFFLSLFASNYLKPQAMFQFRKRFDVIKRSNTTMTIEEKIFNDDFNNFIIRTGEKNPDGRRMKDVLIYDHSKPNKDLVNMISCDSAEMYITDDGKYFVMNLYAGYQYQEDPRDRNKDGTTKYPFMKTSFEHFQKVMDMSQFDFDDDFSFNHRREDMMNSLQLLEALDSVDMERELAMASIQYDYQTLTKTVQTVPLQDMIKSQLILRDTSMRDTSVTIAKSKSKPQNSKPPTIARDKGIVSQVDLSNFSQFKAFYETIDSQSLYLVLNRAVSIAASRSDMSYAVDSKLKSADYAENMYQLRLHQQFSFATICLIFFFIGAPLGSIIRKGGYGYPLLVAIIFYIVFIISSIVGEKLIRSDTINGIYGGWLPCILLFPFSVLFTYHALNDFKMDQLMINMPQILKRKSKVES